jgi:signal peptidase I
MGKGSAKAHIRSDTRTNDYLRMRLLGLMCLFQGTFWILFPFYTVPGRLGLLVLALLLASSVLFLGFSYLLLQKESPAPLRWARITAWACLLVHGVLAFFCTDVVFNFYFSTDQPLFRYLSGFLLLALTSGVPGDLLVIYLVAGLEKRVREETFNPDRQLFREANKRFELFEALFVALILAVFIRTYFVQAFKIPSGSMEDTLLIGDHLLVNKFLYGTRLPVIDREVLQVRTPERGDVIVFEFPQDAGEPYFKRRDFIKRVVGLPGDVVEIRNKQVYVNGQSLNFPQEVHKEQDVLPPEVSPRDFLRAVRVPEGKYFAMGDNRDRSFDSRFWGFVDHSKIRGKAWVKYWSWDPDKGGPRWDRIGRLIN